MWFVYSQHRDQRARLQQDYPLRDQLYQVPATDTPTLQAILRSIIFEYFQNKPSPLAQKMTAFANCCLANTVSLALFREAVGLAAKQNQDIRHYRQYCAALDAVLGQGTQDLQSSFSSEGDSNQQLFRRAEQGQMRMTKYLDMTELHQQLEREMKQKEILRLQTGAHTLAGNWKDIEYNPQNTPHKNSKLTNFLSNVEGYYGQDDAWWKTQKKQTVRQSKGSDESKQMTKFEVKMKNMLKNNSIGQMVVDECKYQLNREIELGRDINKHQELQTFKYNRMMKNIRRDAKLKKKKMGKK